MTNYADGLRKFLLTEDSEFYETLGRFIASYAAAEAGVHSLARHFLGVTDEKARAIFGGMRLGDLTDRIRQMMRTDKIFPETVQEVETCLVQLDIAATERNKFVHRTTNFLDNSLVVTNAVIARSLSNMEFQSFSKSQLSDLYMDCTMIFLRLSYVVKPSLNTRGAAWDLLISAPWRYIPLEPKPQKKPPRKAPGSQKRQPRA